VQERRLEMASRRAVVSHKDQFVLALGLNAFRVSRGYNYGMDTTRHFAWILFPDGTYKQARFATPPAIGQAARIKRGAGVIGKLQAARDKAEGREVGVVAEPPPPRAQQLLNRLCPKIARGELV
jgi:hypothetical protein